MTSWNVVRLGDIAATPWRNGGGTTRELAVWPSAEDWTWRMSVAEVEQNGPFSVFNGVDRWFAVLEGAGVQLDVAGRRCVLRPADEPFFFDGAAAVDCQLLAGKTEDFNLMVQRSSAKSRMQRVTGHFEAQLDATKFIAIYNRNNWANTLFGSENMNLPPSSLAWRQVHIQTPIALTAEDALWMEISL